MLTSSPCAHSHFTQTPLYETPTSQRCQHGSETCFLTERCTVYTHLWVFSCVSLATAGLTALWFSYYYISACKGRTALFFTACPLFVLLKTDQKSRDRLRVVFLVCVNFKRLKQNGNVKSIRFHLKTPSCPSNSHYTL